MKQVRIFNKIMSVVLAMVMVVSMLPMSVFAADPVAKVGNTEYATIDDAIANWTNNTTLTLLDDVTLSDVITLKSTEHHTLDLGTYTMTAASGKHAIEITCEGRSSASYALTVNANSENPGGITATGKSCIYYSKSGSTKDRPIIRIYNGVFNGFYSINSISNGNTNCPQIWIYGGTFNGNVNLTKNMLRVFGGTFNGWINCTGDSSAYREISGGTFKQWQFMTADADNKFWVGTSKANYDVGAYIDDNGYLVVGGPVVTEAGEAFEASSANYGGFSSYLKYSSVKDNGLYYTSVEEAFADNNKTTDSVTVYVDVLDMTGINYKGTIVVPEGKTLTITNAPEGLKTKGNVVVVKPAVKIGENGYDDLTKALDAAKTMTGDVTVEINDKVTLNTSLSGSYDSITFVGKDADAEIYLDVQGYITATGKKVAFEDLTLSKAAGGYIDNAGFMNVAFGVYDVAEVTYIGCTFANGACASSGKVTFTDCTFKRSHDKYGLWAYGDVDVTVDDCTFDDYRGIKMYAEGAAKTVDLIVKNTDFSAVTDKPAIVLTHGESVTLEGNTYSSTGVFELDLDGAPNGTPVTSDVAPTCKNDNGACGVLVDGKIYTTVAQAAEVATAGSEVTLLHDSAETVEFVEGVILDKNGYTAAGVTVAQPAAGLEGEGTAEDPFIVADIDDLKWFRDAVNGGNTYAGQYFKLTESIDLAATASAYSMRSVIPNWEPIGTKTNPFKGTFDGDGETISNLIVVGEANQGLFGYADNATIKNVTIVNAYVKGTDCVGAVAGQVYSISQIDNCHVSGTIQIEGQTNVGGIVGKYYTKVTNCSVIGDGVDTSYVKGVYVESDLEGDNIGGIMGHCGENNNLTGNTVKNITVSGTRKVGGIVGIADQNTDVTGNVVKNVVVETTAAADYAASKVATMSIGGLIGQYQAASGNNDGMVTGNTIEGVTFAIPEGVTCEAGVIVGGARGGSDGMLAPSVNVTAENNAVTNVTGATNKYLMPVVATVNGVEYGTLSEAFAAVTSDNDDVIILSDVTENLTGAYLRGNIVAEDDVTITLTNTDWVYLPYTFVVGENVTLKAPALFYYAGGAQINGTVIAEQYYQRYAGTKLTINEPGNLTITGDGTIIRYMDGDPYAGIYVNGDNDDATVGLKAAVIYFYQGMINAKDATIQVGTCWQTNETDGQGSANLVLDNTKMNVTVNEHNAKATGNSTVTLTNGSNLTCAGEFVYGENAVISVDATSGIYDKNGKVEFATPVAKIGETEYFDLHEAMMAAKAGETVLLLTDVDLAGTEWEPVSFKGLFNGQGNTIHNLTINKPGVSNTGFITSLNGTFENVTFTNPTVTGGENTGVVAGRAGGGAALARNITVNGTIKVETTHSGYARTGVIVGGWAYGNYVDITVDGDDPAVSYVKHSGGGDGRYVAGIVGHADDVDSYVNCTVKNISIISENDGWLCGGIAGPGPSDGSASGCVVENVKIGADYSGGMFGWYYGNGTIENSTIKNVEFTASTTKNGAIGGYGVNNDANVTNVTIENVTNGGAALLEHVAEIDGTYYFALQEAIDAANSGDTVKLLRDVEVSNTINVETNIVLDGNNHKIVPASDFVANGHGAVIALAASASDYSADSDYTIKNLTFEGFSGLNRVVRANFGDIVIDNCQFVNNTVTGGVITSSFAELTVDGCAFDGNTVSGYGVIDVGSDVSNGTEVVANITDSSFTNNNAAIAGIYLASSANVTGNYFSGNTHTGDNDNGAAILAGPYTGNMAYTIVVNENAFVNAMNGKPAVFAEDWSSLGSTTDFNLNGNYWNGGEPADGYLTSGSNPDVTLENYYATYEDGVLSNLVEISSGLSGSGTEEDPYLIKSIEDLILFRDSVNAGETTYNAEGVYVALGANIDMAGIDWSVNIGDDCNATFDGIFDGQNYTIYNLTAVETAQKGDGYVCGGLFGAIYGSAVIKNLTIEKVTIDAGFTGNNVGAVVGFAFNTTGSVENVKVTGDIAINAEGVTGVGAIVGYDYYGELTVKDCSVVGNDGSFITGASYVGGVIGYASSNSNINNNTVENVAITGKAAVGGIAGIMLGSGKADGNSVKDVALTVTHENWQNSAAAVVGAISGGAITVSNTTVESVTANGVATTALVGAKHADKPTAPLGKVEARIGDVYYATLAAALEANVEGEVVLLTPITIAAGETVTIDLNGKTVSYSGDKAGEAMITNKGILTITDSTTDAAGKIVYTYTGAADSAYTKGNYTICNTGTLTVEKGTVENATVAMSHACYTIDNNSINSAATLTINGGKVLNNNNYAVRQIGGNHANSVTVNGGEIEGTRAIWVQLAGSDASVAPEMNLTVTDGILTGNQVDSSGNKLAIYSYSYGNDMKNVEMNISGGTFNGDVALTGGKNKTNIETVNVSGGTFNGVWGELYSYGEEAKAVEAISITGGTFATNGAEMYALDDGYKFVENADGTYSVVAEEAMTGSISLTAATLNLQGKVSVMYRVETGSIPTNEADVAERGVLLYASAEAAATKDPGLAYEVVALETAEGENAYVGQTEGIDARDMGKSQFAVAYLRMVDGTYIFGMRDGKDQVVEYSPLIYCKRTVANSSTTETVKNLCNALMQYGAAAQIDQYEEDERGPLMNEEFDEIAFDESVLGESVFAANTEWVNGMKLAGVTMDLKGLISYMVQFSTDSSIADKQMYAEYSLLGETKRMELDEKLIAVIDGTPAKDMGATLKVKAYYLDENGEKVYGGELVYSAYEYVRRALTNASFKETTKDLARALAMYVHYADAYGKQVK